MRYEFDISKETAERLDTWDELAAFRRRFYLLPGKIYMDGNSLGLASKDAEATLLRLLEEWKEHGINGWMSAAIPWFFYPEELAKLMAPLFGADAAELTVTAGTTVNLHSLIAAFFRPEGRRTKLLADELNFPSDIYALRSQLRLRGLDPAENLSLVSSRDGRTLDEADIVSAMNDEIAVALLPSVLYRSGQLLDMRYLTEEAHKRGILIGFDCSHSAGSVSHRLSEWNVDFAFWCNYKYLNAGPGSTATIYLNSRHFGLEPGLAGWFGYRKDKQFDMLLDFESAVTAQAFQIGTTNLFSTAPLEGSLRIFQEAGMDRIRAKSLQQTAYLMYLIDELISDEPYNYQIGTPREPEKRGGHVAVEHAEALRINEALKNRGVVPDFRYPNVIRLAPVALYTTYSEIWEAVQHLKAIIDAKEFERYPTERGVVA